MADTITLYSHRQGANPWKTVTILEELGLPYETIFLEFGNVKNGVEGSNFLKKNPAGRVPLIYDPQTGISLTESNAIAKYLVDRYDTESRLFIRGLPEEYLMHQWLYFQGATQGTIFQQALIFSTTKDEPAALGYLQGIVKRTLKTVDTALEGKQYLVSDQCTIADLAFVNWDLTLDDGLNGDQDAATMEQREKLYPNWAAWHRRLIARPSVQRMMEMQEEANAKL